MVNSIILANRAEAFVIVLSSLTLIHIKKEGKDQVSILSSTTSDT